MPTISMIDQGGNMDISPEAISVKANDDYTLLLEFDNGEIGIFDMKPYLEKGIFRELKSLTMFRSVRIKLGTVVWANEADLCPDTLYLKSKRKSHVNQ